FFYRDIAVGNQLVRDQPVFFQVSSQLLGLYGGKNCLRVFWRLFQPPSCEQAYGDKNRQGIPNGTRPRPGGRPALPAPGNARLNTCRQLLEISVRDLENVLFGYVFEFFHFYML